MKTLDTKWKLFGLTSQGTRLRGEKRYNEVQQRSCTLRQPLMAGWHLSCLYAAFHTVKAVDLSFSSAVKVLVWGDQAGETEKNRGTEWKKRQWETGIDIKWKRTAEEWWISEGWIGDERDEMCGGEGHRRGRRGGQRMERLVVGNRVSLNANSSHLERLMDRGQHFCTYPGSLPPQSITRQSIKSSKKPRKALAKALRVWCCFLLLYCFYLNLMCACFMLI